MADSAAISEIAGLGRVILRCREADITSVSGRIDLELPRHACLSESRGGLSCLWLGPDEWLLLNYSRTDRWISHLEAKLDGIVRSLVDVSDRQIALAVRGSRAEMILATGCSLDLSVETFPVGMCTRTMFAKAEVVLWRTATDGFHVEVARSYARYVETLLRQAENEFELIDKRHQSMTEEQIYDEFERSGIAFEKLEHDPVFTVEESAAIHKVMTAAHTKNLFLKDKGGSFWLVVLPSDRRADLRAIAKNVGAGKFSFGKAEDMERLLRVAPGAVTPIAAANAPPGIVPVVFDASFEKQERIAVHPLRNSATIALAFDRLIEWLSEKGVPVQIAPIP
jgi:Ala-tRNA(Pro) deacylase